MKPQRLVILLDEKGNVGIEGPVDNKLLCYGLLGLAHDCISDYHRALAEAERSARIQAASNADILSINGARKK